MRFGEHAGARCRRGRGTTTRAIAIAVGVAVSFSIGCSPTNLALKAAHMPVLPYRSMRYEQVLHAEALQGTMAFAGLETNSLSANWSDGNVEHMLYLNKQAPATVFGALSGLFRDGIGTHASYAPMPASETERYAREIKDRYYVLANSMPGFIQAVDVSKDVARIDTCCLKHWEANFPADHYLYFRADIDRISVAMGGGLNVSPSLIVYVLDRRGNHVFAKRYIAKYRLKPAPEGEALADSCCALFANLAADQRQEILADLRCITTLVPAGRPSLDQAGR